MPLVTCKRGHLKPSHGRCWHCNKECREGQRKAKAKRHEVKRPTWIVASPVLMQEAKQEYEKALGGTSLVFAFSKAFDL